MGVRDCKYTCISCIYTLISIEQVSKRSVTIHKRVIGILMRRNMRFGAAVVIERLTDSTRRHINAVHVIVEIIAG